MSTVFKARLEAFDAALDEDVINHSNLRQLCFAGIPEGKGRRALSWRLLLNFLPMEKKTWNDFLHQQRQLYAQLTDEYVLQPQSEKNEDHPLNPNPDSQWQSFFKDNDVLLQIDKDVRRLCPDINFFSQATDFPNKKIAGGQYEQLHQRVNRTVLKSQNLERKGLGIAKLSLLKKKATETYAPLAKGQEAHWEVVQRILFLYAKLNPGQSYVQGMNEIIGPIYYVFASDPNNEWKEHAEADCFFCFTNLMSDIRDFFIKTLDEAESGINGMMLRFYRKIKFMDAKVEARLVDQDIKPQYFSFRWLTLMLSQEFALPDVLRIWDSLLADETRSDFLIDVCTAMVLVIREDILTNDFADNVKLLQNFPPMDVHVILSKAAAISS